jgi:hypothetical protein
MIKLILCVALVMPFVCTAQTPGYFDVFIDHVKPDRRAQYDAGIKKMVEYNRKHNGDMWIAGETVYGDVNTIMYNSARTNMAAVDAAIKAFRGAMTAALGGPGMETFFQGINASVNSSHAELRRPRPDLSTNQPPEAEILKMVGQTRYVRTFTVRVRAGRGPEYEKQLLMAKEAGESASVKGVSLVSQGAGGQNGTVFYITHLLKTLGDLDAFPALAQTLGSKYARYTEMSAANVISTESTIYRLLPELSNAPPPIVAADPEFWSPKPKAASAKPKPAAEKK